MIPLWWPLVPESLLSSGLCVKCLTPGRLLIHPVTVWPRAPDKAGPRGEATGGKRRASASHPGCGDRAPNPPGRSLETHNSDNDISSPNLLARSICISLSQYGAALPKWHADHLLDYLSCRRHRRRWCLFTDQCSGNVSMEWARGEACLCVFDKDKELL